MQKIIFVAVLLCTCYSSFLHAQEKSSGNWFVEAGPYIGLARWTLGITNSLGIGVDARAGKNFSDNFSGGGRITYAYFLGKNKKNINGKGISLAGIYANLQYTHDEKYVVGGDLGLGFSSSDGNSDVGFAKTGYLGYQFKQDERLITVAAYMNRTTFATYNIGIKSWIRF